MIKVERALNVNLHLPKGMVEQLQDECEEFDFNLDEFISFVLIAVMSRNIVVDSSCLYECIDWKSMKEEGLCE